MQIYSRNILAFNEKCRKLVCSILSEEVGLPVRRTRFEYQGYLLPIKVKSFKDTRKLKTQVLGQFDAQKYLINLNYSALAQVEEGLLLNLLRHEVAHYLVALKYDASSVAPHGKEFKDLCLSYGWDKDVYSAHIEETQIEQSALKKQKRYEKLMKLSESDNEHEAMLALQKAQQLMTHFSFQPEEEVYFLDTLGRFKRRSAKLFAIQSIMEQLGFGVITHSYKEGVDFECFGPRELVEQGRNVFHYLDSSLENIWLKIKTEQGLKGVSAKNSFMQGFEKGVLFSLNKNKKNFTAHQKKALIELNLIVESAQKMIYPSVSYGRSGGKTDFSALNSGFNQGRKFDPRFTKHKYLQ